MSRLSNLILALVFLFALVQGAENVWQNNHTTEEENRTDQADLDWFKARPEVKAYRRANGYPEYRDHRRQPHPHD
jgi:hypothetical protein